MCSAYKIILLIVAVNLGMVHSFCQSVDFSRASIFVPDQNDSEIQKPLQVLREEIAKRTGINLPVGKKIRLSGTGLISIIPLNKPAKIPAAWRAQLQNMPPTGKDGFKLVFLQQANTILIAGNDRRSLLYGVGRLLRKMELSRGQVFIPANISISTTPQFAIRGHQLGYRPKTNSYDAFSVGQFDQYIRELALFGANSIEILPPRTDDDATSRHMKLPAMQMIAEQSRICKEYGLDVWMWYPNMGADYQHPDSIRNELNERRAVFAAVPKLDALFVPGGDPGDLAPDVLFRWLEKLASVLHEYHPNAKIWVSPQVFRPTTEWSESFYKQVNHRYPWFGGVVYGPWINTPVAVLRKKIDAGIPIRMYPDITHSLSSQYPVPDWDLAFAMTLGRECINPRPQDEKHIQNVFAKFGSGSISYSEGTNDDVNKFVWSDQDWDTTTAVIETLRDYARFFIGPAYTEAVAQGIINLEGNGRGPVLTNETIPLTLLQWQDLEKKASGNVMQNFRFQMCLLLAYYDAYVRQRLIRETAVEQEARSVLSAAIENNSLLAISRAKRILLETHPGSADTIYRQRCRALADSLFKSIGAQLTIEPHGATPGRGNFIDNIDIALNDSPWLLDQLQRIEKISDGEERLNSIHALLHREDPGPGGFYDNVASLKSRQRILQTNAWEEDPGGLQSATKSFGVGTREDEWVHEIVPQGFGGQLTPRAWMSQVNTLYNQPLQIVYNDLDTGATYRIRIAYTGRFRSKMKLTANGIRVHDFIQTGDKPLYEFDIPKEASATGHIIFTWTCGEGEQGSQVSEIWLMRK